MSRHRPAARAAGRLVERARPAGLALLIALLLAGCSAQAKGGDQLTAQRVDPPFEVASTDLTDTSGHPFSLTADTTKPLSLVFFGYTHCPDTCPLVMSTLAAAMQRLDAADRAQVQVVFVTTDPKRDTAPVLRHWLDRFDPSFVGLSAGFDTLVAVGRSIAVGMGARLPSGGYDTDAHSTQVTAITRDDRAPYYWHQETTAGQYAADIHTLLATGAGS